MKRVIDLGLSSLMMVLAAPLLLVILIVVLVDDGRPVLFRQSRVGRRGRCFSMVKFRTMRCEEGPHLTVGADVRITRSGRFLRASKLDELPQLVNVVRGEMSLVGWRPELPEYVMRSAPLFDPLLAFRPGIVDPSALRFRHESELLADQADPETYYLETVLPEKVRLSLEYAGRASIRTDLGVLARLLA